MNPDQNAYKEQGGTAPSLSERLLVAASISSWMCMIWPLSEIRVLGLVWY